MKISVITCLGIILFLLTACREEEFDQNHVKDFSFTSSINGSTYPIKVALPKNYSTASKYKALYVLDSKWDFNLVAQEVQKQSEKFQRYDVLVVGIGWGNDRLDDYLPVPYKSGTGRADEFVKVINNELIPRIENEFHAAQSREDRTILGHSAGGLLSAYCFTNYPDIFGSYLCLSPSLWVGNQIVLIHEKKNRPGNQARNGRFFLAAGELEDGGMLPPIEAFRLILSQHYTGFSQAYNLAGGLDHLGSKKTNIRKAISFYFHQL
ncbi:alpha/beta hydrolase [Chryseobacterium sp. Tr-659]|uniref:alpha/beta hydrolase n=1 Tax=Chryseobacterium sp. Tr-659 TaxID=2608340 RepID=UPI00141EA258|nr:alpha/beta hydrolase-fold protein [Chryseobacterium sp. Tr-659]NIF06276.1 alpha/beta hydrolase [Chryseobacterium sp. Tr-659]